MIKLTNYLSHSYGKPDSYKLAAYEAAGGYRGVRKTLGLTRDQVIDEMKKAHIRGRGGAGFDCGTKWSFMPKEVKKPHYLVVNADEGEPGTFKDRVLLTSHADMVCEGMTVCAHAIGARQGFIYLRGEYRYLLPALKAVLDRRRRAALPGRGILGDRGVDFAIDIVVRGGKVYVNDVNVVTADVQASNGVIHVIDSVLLPQVAPAPAGR